MIQITVRQFRANLKKYLAIPCQVVSRGVPIASIVPVKPLEKVGPPKVVRGVIKYPEPSKSATVEPKIIQFTEITVGGSKFRVCPHRNESGQCPMGCVEVNL